MLPSGDTTNGPLMGWLGSVSVTWISSTSSGSIRYGGLGTMRAASMKRMSGGATVYGGSDTLLISVGIGPGPLLSQPPAVANCATATWPTMGCPWESSPT